MVMIEFSDDGSSSYKTSVLFNDCGIINVPPKSFPSYLNTIKFLNCKIGILSSKFIQSLRMDRIIFESTVVDEIQSEAFYDNSLIDYLTAQKSRFKKIHPMAVASGIQHLTWTECEIDEIDSRGVNGAVGNLRIEKSVLHKVQPQGLSIYSWTLMSLINNTFTEVKKHGIDLTGPYEATSSIQKPASLQGNTWVNVETDFVRTGSTDTPFVHVGDNTFKQLCSCETTFTSSLSLNGSRSWFHDEMFGNSQCPIDEKSRLCLSSEQNSSGVEIGYISYADLSRLCSPEIFMCLSEVSDVEVPVPTNGFPLLQVLAFGFGLLTFIIFVSVCLCGICCNCKRHRKSTGKEDSNNEAGNGLSCDLPRKEFVKTINPDQYSALNVKEPNLTPSLRSRVALLKDVEMEDKGVQTMPAELSAEIIEELRGKLSNTTPDSFWNQKQATYTINDMDALPPFPLSSPPDVTICNETSEATPANTNSSKSHNLSSDSLKLLLSPARRPIKLISSNNRGEARKSMSTFAQVPSPPQHHPPAMGQAFPNNQCGDPIYSELVAGQGMNNHPGGKLAGLLSLSSKIPNPHALPPTSPMLCEYTEPRDFNSHIYAELTGQPLIRSPTKSSVTQTVDPVGGHFKDTKSTEIEEKGIQLPPPLPSSVIPQMSPQHQLYTFKLNDLNSEPHYSLTLGVPYCPTDTDVRNESKSVSNNIPASTALSHTASSNNPSPNKRPLPSIPSPSISTHL
jgi:hypothetical protein